MSGGQRIVVGRATSREAIIQPPASAEWEHVAGMQIDRAGSLASFYGDTSRLRVPGGWLYLTTMYTYDSVSVPCLHQAFVPDAGEEEQR